MVSELYVSPHLPKLLRSAFEVEVPPFLERHNNPLSHTCTTCTFRTDLFCFVFGFLGGGLLSGVCCYFRRAIMWIISLYI
jgi:hypothetical protein